MYKMSCILEGMTPRLRVFRRLPGLLWMYNYGNIVSELKITCYTVPHNIFLYILLLFQWEMVFYRQISVTFLRLITTFIYISID